MRAGFHDQFRQRPFVFLVSCLAAGVVLSRAVEVELFRAVTFLGLALIALVFPRIRWVGLFGSVFCLGLALYSARYTILSEDDLRLIVEEKPALVTVRGRLVESPGLREYPGRTNNNLSSLARVEVGEILFEKQWRPATGLVASTTPGALFPDYFKGRRVEVTGVLNLPPEASAPGLFNFRQYLYNSRVFYQLRCESTNDWQLLSFEPLPLTEKFQRWAHAQLGRGLPERDEPLEMVRAMALGMTQSLNGEIAEAFMRTGTMHIFAISGLHVACIAACILAVLRVAGVPRDRAALLLIPLVWFYTLATGWQSSAVRSALMSTFVFAGWALRRPTELLNSTAGAAFLILLFQPEQLFQASFQLSFSVVAAIAVILGAQRGEEPWTLGLQNRILRYDPLLLPALRPAWKRWLEVPLAFFLGNLAISGASWIGSNPLTAYYFNMVTPISLVANLIAVPLSSISLACTLGSLLVPPLGPVFNYLSWATMWETIVATRWLAEISWGSFYVPQPNLWFFPAYFALCAVCFLPELRTVTLRRWSILATAATVLLWLGSLLPSARSTTLTLLPAQGTPLLVDAPGRRDDLLIDCSNARGAEQMLKRFLHGQGFGSLRQVLLTQGDSAHTGGLPSVLTNFSPRVVMTGGMRPRSRVYRAAIREAEEKSGPVQEVQSGDARAGWTVLHPVPGQRSSKAADNSVVVRREIHGWSVLYVGDVGQLGQKSLLERGDALRADILMCGSAAELDPALIATVAPRLVVLGRVETSFKRGRKRSSVPGTSEMQVVEMKQARAVVLRLSEKECRVESGGPAFTLERSGQ